MKAKINTFALFFLSFDINSYRSGHDHETVGQLFVTDTSFFNVFLICLKKHYSLLEGN